MLIKRHHKKVTFIVIFTQSQLRRRKIKDIPHLGDTYKSIRTPLLPPIPTSPPRLTHTHTPLLPQNSSKSKLYPLAKGRVCVTITQEDSSQVETYLTVKTSQLCKCKLFVSVSFLDYAENFLLKVKLKGNKFYEI